MTTENTTTPPVQFGYIDLNLIVASTTNPRKIFEPSAMAELTANIKASGVHQPVLLRTLPASRLEDTAHMQPRPIYELVCGERRLRASQSAGLNNIPAMVAELTDSQALEVQVVENLQRTDLSALEEAEGYDVLMQTANITADQVAEKIGKSKAYVYARIKLLDLGTDGREALKNGLIDASRALLLARIPDTTLQAKALNEIVRPNHYRGTMSAREAAEHIRNSYMLKLSTAVFDIKDALLTSATACKSCTKRSGANPDLFADVKGADVCTDPACFESKTQAHYAAIRLNAEKLGHDIIDGREALEIMPQKWNGIEGYARLDVATDSPTGKPLRKLLSKVMDQEGIKPTMVANPHVPGEIIACVPVNQLPELLAKAGKDEAAKKANDLAQAQEEHAAERALQEEQHAFERRWRVELMSRIFEKTGATWISKLPVDVERYILQEFISTMNADQCKRLIKLLDLGKVAPKEGIKQWAYNLSGSNVAAALCIVVAFRDIEYRHWLSDETQANKGLFLVAKELGIEPNDVRNLVITQVRDEKAAAEEKASAPPPPAAQTKGRGGKEKNKKPSLANAPAKKPKLSAKDAMQGIADAMQNQNETLGDSAQGQDQCATRNDNKSDQDGPWLADVTNQDQGSNEGGAV